MTHLVHPEISARVHAELALSELARAGYIQVPFEPAAETGSLVADTTATLSSGRLRVSAATLLSGHTRLDASGELNVAERSGGFRFHTAATLAELGHLLRVAARPEGLADISGEASFSNGSYRITAHARGSRIGFLAGHTRLRGIDIASDLVATPERIECHGIRLRAFGGTFLGTAVLLDQDRFRVAGALHGLELATVWSQLDGRTLP